MSEVSVVYFPSLEKISKLDGIFVLIDVLRASSTIITLFQKGCKYVIPTKSSIESMEVKRELSLSQPDSKIYLCGEDEFGNIFQNYDFQNSPSDVNDVNLENSTIIFNSTNATKVLRDNNFRFIIASFINASSIVRYLCSLIGSQDLYIICSGRKSGYKLSADDSYLAGFIVSELSKDIDIKLDDSAIVAKVFYESISSSNEVTKEQLFSSFDTVKRLSSRGKIKDVDFSFSLNKTEIIPVYEPGMKHINLCNT